MACFFLCCLLVTRNMKFLWYWYQPLKFWTIPRIFQIAVFVRLLVVWRLSVSDRFTTSPPAVTWDPDMQIQMCVCLCASKKQKKVTKTVGSAQMEIFLCHIGVIRLSLSILPLAPLHTTFLHPVHFLPVRVFCRLMAGVFVQLYGCCRLRPATAESGVENGHAVIT